MRIFKMSSKQIIDNSSRYLIINGESKHAQFRKYHWSYFSASERCYWHLYNIAKMKYKLSNPRGGVTWVSKTYGVI